MPMKSLSLETTSPPMKSPATNVDPTMAIVLVCLLSAFFMICVISAYFRHYAERQLRLAASTPNGSEIGSVRSVVRGLDPSVITTFASFTYSSVKGIKIGQSELECAVCLNEFQDHETLRLLPKCSHVFHRECIDTWLNSHVTCPVCRADLILSSRPGETSHLNESWSTGSLQCPIDHDIDFNSTEFLLPNESKKIVPPTTGVIPRSQSTGRSVVVNVERYTLRLPNEAFLNPVTVTSLPASPHMAFPAETSRKMSFRSVSVGSATYGTTRDGSSGSHVANGNPNDIIRTSNSQPFFRSPFDRFNMNFDVNNN